ncbi:butyrophilin subfamily 1 member A1-like isoform X3 [Pleurodeles waltl]|uniref:butyrophilin subfamily 1 member A1-like isoform X3 n=1 Tax=Pleurodeles waltl TaxID=8319 RepID=UPI0037099F3C
MKIKSLTMTIYSLKFFLLCVTPSLQVKFSVIGPDLPLVIPPGEDAVLSCHLSPQISAENMTIRWFKGKYYNLVHLYQRREDQYQNQMAEYRSRTHLNKDGIILGSVSLIINNVRPSDSGLYTCFYDTESFYEEAVVELKVADAFFQRISSCVLSRLLISASFTVLGILLISWTVYLFKEKKKEKRRLSNELDWRRARLFSAAVTLDPDTAHRRLILSEDGRSVRHRDRAQDLPDTPLRFNHTVIVLGRERLSSGRHYWEVEVGDKTGWDLGVCDEAVTRKGKITTSPEKGYWTVWLRDGEYEALTVPSTLLTPRAPPRAVGLFLDHEAGRLSLYNVDDRSLLFTFSGASFPPTLRPFFCPGLNEGGRNAGALRILPVTGRE